MAAKKPGYKATTVYLSTHNLQLLKLLAVKSDKSQDYILQQIVGDYLDEKVAEGELPELFPEKLMKIDEAHQDDMAGDEELSPADRERYGTLQNKRRVERAVAGMSSQERSAYLIKSGVTTKDLEDMDEIEVEMTVKQLFALPPSPSTGGRRRSAVARLKPTMNPKRKEANGKDKSSTRKRA